MTKGGGEREEGGGGGGGGEGVRVEVLEKLGGPCYSHVQ